MMLTQRQLKLMKFIKSFVKKNRICPSMREMAVGINLSPKSYSTIHYQLKRLEERGYIRRLPERARAIEIKKEI